MYHIKVSAYPKETLFSQLLLQLIIALEENYGVLFVWNSNYGSRKQDEEN